MSATRREGVNKNYFLAPFYCKIVISHNGTTILICIQYRFLILLNICREYFSDFGNVIGVEQVKWHDTGNNFFYLNVFPMTPPKKKGILFVSFKLTFLILFVCS